MSRALTAACSEVCDDARIPGTGAKMNDSPTCKPKKRGGLLKSDRAQVSTRYITGTSTHINMLTTR
eukprot:3043185-Amphidinium_carterae.1